MDNVYYYYVTRNNNHYIIITEDNNKRSSPNAHSISLNLFSFSFFIFFSKKNCCNFNFSGKKTPKQSPNHHHCHHETCRQKFFIYSFFVTFWWMMILWNSWLGLKTKNRKKNWKASGRVNERSVRCLVSNIFFSIMKNWIKNYYYFRYKISLLYRIRIRLKSEQTKCWSHVHRFIHSFIWYITSRMMLTYIDRRTHPLNERREEKNNENKLITFIQKRW